MPSWNLFGLPLMPLRAYRADPGECRDSSHIAHANCGANACAAFENANYCARIRDLSAATGGNCAQFCDSCDSACSHRAERRARCRAHYSASRFDCHFEHLDARRKEAPTALVESFRQSQTSCPVPRSEFRLELFSRNSLEAPLASVSSLHSRDKTRMPNVSCG